MQRREFFKTAAIPLFLSSSNLFANVNSNDGFNIFADFFEMEHKNSFGMKKETAYKIEEKKSEDGFIKKDFFQKNDTPDRLDKKLNEDLYVDEKYINEFKSVRTKLNGIQSYVGHGNFNILGFDEMLKIAKTSRKIGNFTKKELDFFEYIFYYNPSIHGFYGKRISKNITDIIDKNKIIKIPGTGHFLFKGEPYEVYFRMLKDVGNTLVLTSGVRSIVKQTKLFLDKVNSVDGNITIASKSLAPPAFTYHSVSDFDVGKKGFGHANFSPRFALTQEFFKMRKLKYIDMRYTINNKDGVRYEPWHVKVI